MDVKYFAVIKMQTNGSVWWRKWNRDKDEEDENIEDGSTSSTDEEESVSSDIYGSDN